MPTLKEQLRADLTAAMKARDETTTRTLRMVLTSISNEEVSGNSARDLSDDEVMKIVGREAKRRREAAAAFADAGRDEQAAAERAEEDVLSAYLPAQLSDDELAALVAAAIAETGASGPSGIGPVMKAVTPKVAGRAEGSRVAAAVRSQLAG
ncbi:MAG TPA: GatB/YqeY domain-containing protein [Streptosporangiaceae bacterium]|nr:GatB/YqeY domain-containing protein [Streptosporangiaceae bacterium]